LRIEVNRLRIIRQRERVHGRRIDHDLAEFGNVADVVVFIKAALHAPSARFVTPKPLRATVRSPSRRAEKIRRDATPN